MPLPRLLPLLLLPLALAGCRDHNQARGRYQLTATAVTEDGCGLVGAGGNLGELALRTYGNEVQAHLDLLDVDLDGRYLRDVETFRVAGSASDVPVEVQGQACEVQLLQVVLLARTLNQGLAFQGPLVVTYDDARHPACVCALEAEVRADWFAPPG